MEFKILYDDADIVVCIKPQGIISQSDSFGKKNMVSLLKEELLTEIFPVHRLDKETGGIMVFAKNQKSAAELSKAIIENGFHKEYLALLHNDINKDSDMLTDLLYHDRQKNKSYVVKRQRNGVKRAVLEYNKLSNVNIDGIECSLVRINLKTGRTHQIRVQFSYRGYPLLGDRKYGASDNQKAMGLWAYKLVFNHPKTNLQMFFEALPNENTPFGGIDLKNILSSVN